MLAPGRKPSRRFARAAFAPRLHQCRAREVIELNVGCCRVDWKLWVPDITDPRQAGMHNANAVLLLVLVRGFFNYNTFARGLL